MLLDDCTSANALADLALRLRACGDRAAEIGMHSVAIDCHAEARSVEAAAAAVDAQVLYIGGGVAKVAGIERALRSDLRFPKTTRYDVEYRASGLLARSVEIEAVTSQDARAAAELGIRSGETVGKVTLAASCR